MNKSVGIVHISPVLIAKIENLCLIADHAVMSGLLSEEQAERAIGDWVGDNMGPYLSFSDGGQS